MCFCVKHLERLSSFWERKRSPQRAGPSQVPPCYLWKTRIVWIKSLMPRWTASATTKSHDSFPKPWKKAKGQTNQWHFGSYLASNTDRPPSVWHECKCEKCSFIYTGASAMISAVLSWLTWFTSSQTVEEEAKLQKEAQQELNAWRFLRLTAEQITSTRCWWVSETAVRSIKAAKTIK